MTTLSRHHVEFEQDGIQFDLWRITLEEYHQLRSNSLPIQDKSGFALKLAMREFYELDHLKLPQSFLTLEHLFGETSDWFDDWKGSFSFPLLLVLQKHEEKFFYLLKICDHQGSLCFDLYRILKYGINGYKIDVYQPPFEAEFSSGEIHEFLTYLYGYMLGVSKWVCKVPPSPFLKHIDSNNIIYGFCDGKLFEEQIESEEEYKQAIEKFERTYGSIAAEKESSDIKSLLKRVTGLCRDALG
jgi:hypothetical protein